MAPQMRAAHHHDRLIAFVLGMLIINSLFSHQNVKTITYSQLLRDAKTNQVDTATINNDERRASPGQLTNGDNYTPNGPMPARQSAR